MQALKGYLKKPWEWKRRNQSNELSKVQIFKRLKQKYPNLKAIQINTIIEVFISTLSKGLLSKRSIEIRSFGTFFIKEIKEKKSARNPKTGEIIYIPKKNKVRFRASKDLKEYINQMLWKNYLLLAILQIKKILKI